MTSEQWRQVEDLFHEALDRAPDARTAYLDLACADDQALRQHVEDLLASFDDAGDFIEKSLVDDSLPSSAKASTSSESIVGHKIGNYEILSLLGAGGMGEVYLARDVRLDRRIALKFLPEQFTNDAAQVRRFEREARAASALNHPNIITIYEVGLERILHRALAKDRAARYQTAAELRDDLQRLEHKLASAGKASSLKRLTAQWRRRRVTASLVLGGVVVFAAVGLWPSGQNDAKAPASEPWSNARSIRLTHQYRRLLYLHDGKILLVDSENKKTQEILSAAPHKITHFVISRDNRLLYFDVDASEADIWMLSLN